MYIGYCRISRRSQNIERQERNIKAAYPEAVIVKEAFTGTRIDRPEWNKLFQRVKAGDTIVFDSVSRMSRNAEEGVKVYFDLLQREVDLVFLKEPHINTAVYSNALKNTVPLVGGTVDVILDGVNKYLMLLAKEQIEIAFQQAQKEVDDLHARTREGIETARLNGKQIGRKTGDSPMTAKEKFFKPLMKEKLISFGGRLTDEEFLAMSHNGQRISRNTFYKYKGELKEEP